MAVGEIGGGVLLFLSSIPPSIILTAGSGGTAALAVATVEAVVVAASGSMVIHGGAVIVHNFASPVRGGGRGSGRRVINTQKGPLYTSQNRGDTKRYVKENWYHGTFASELDSAAYHLNKHAPGSTIQEYTTQAQNFFKANWRSATEVSNVNGEMTLLGINNNNGFGIFTPDGRVVTFHP
ncbi:MAG: hypothetical protein GY833_01565 [Aestuariibacter sp.]|nr:hypothetical protein [Aestuariibacter sp.]